MKKVNWQEYKFRSSQIYRLMTASSSQITPLQVRKIAELSAKASLTEKQSEELRRLIGKRDAPPRLSDTAMEYLREIYMKEVWGREEVIYGKALEKGTDCEEDTLTLASEVLGEFFEKNEKRYSNEYIEGTPDIVLEDEILDAKTCWSMASFMKKDRIETPYYWQLQAYMWLAGFTRSRLLYGLVNTPEHLVVQEKSKTLYMTGLSDTSPEWLVEEERIDRLHHFDNVPANMRIKVYNCERRDEDIELMKKKIVEARFVLSTLSL